MPVRLGGSYLRDPETGELTPNLPADNAADANTQRATEPGLDGDLAIGARGEGSAADNTIVTVTPPLSTMSAERAAAVGALIEAASAELTAKSETRRKANKKDL